MSKLPAIHELCLKYRDQDLNERLLQLCNFFLHTEYGAWGEGSGLESLDDFSYKLATLDCVTFVEVVLAFAKINPKENLQHFKEDFLNLLRRIQYKNGKPEFLSRNHFMCVDWIPNNKFLLEDITAALTATPAYATATIDKLSWVQHHKIMQQQDQAITPAIAARLAPQTSEIPYITTEEFLLNHAAFKEKFPPYSIVNIVRPNWDLTAQIGTHLNISHLGFAFNAAAADQIAFYHASSERKAVVQDTLFNYLTHFKDSPTIRGFDVLVISPGYFDAR